MQKQRERVEDDKVELEQKATDLVERDERRKTPYNDNFEHRVQDDSTAGSQTDSVTEGSAASASDSENEQEDMGEFQNAIGKEQAEEKKQKRREAREKRKEDNRFPEPMVPAAVIMPLTGMTILTKDGRAISNDPKNPQVGESGLQPFAKARIHAKSSLSSESISFSKAPKIQNMGNVLRPQGSFTTARHPNMTIQTDAIRAKALSSDGRFDTIDYDQLQAAADAGDQIAESHLRLRSRRVEQSQVSGQLILPADLPQNAPPIRRRSTVASPGSRRRSSADSLPEPSRRPSAPVMQSIPEGAPSNAQ